MDETVRDLLERALRMPESSRERLAEALLESLRAAPPPLGAEGREELRRRLGETRAPGYQGTSAEELLARLDDAADR